MMMVATQIPNSLPSNEMISSKTFLSGSIINGDMLNWPWNVLKAELTM